MRYLSFFLLLSLLLCSCAGNKPRQEALESLPAPTAAETPSSATVPEILPPDPVELLLSGMTLEEKVGQLFLARCPDVGAAEDISAYHLGGYILFGRDFEAQTPESLAQTLAAYQSTAKIPLLIATDEEGGSVCRISRYPAFRSAPFPSPRALYAQGGMELVLSVEREKAQLLHSLGINVNMAPVCDIATTPGSFMYDRSLGQDPETTGQFAALTVQTLAGYQVGSVLKHFPGYGSNTDTHTGLAVDDRSLEALESADLLPFAAGMDAGCGAVLVSHTIVTAFDPILPASLSPAVHDYLRNVMGFDGVILTDDLVMDAITEQYDAGEAAVLAVLAGNDLLCSTEYQTQYAAVLAAAQEGRIPPSRLDAAVTRVLRWKQALGLISE